jgi:hypothetical protein
VFSDKGGNDERAAYLYDSSRVSLLEKAGEVAIPPRWASVVKVPGSEQKFEGFDRNPYLTGLLLRQPHSRRGQCPPLFRKRHCVSQESPFHGGVGGRPVGGSAVKVALRL